MRTKKYLLIDAKCAKNIRTKQVGFKVFDEGNALNEYFEKEELSSTENIPINPMSSDLNDLWHTERFKFIRSQK